MEKHCGKLSKCLFVFIEGFSENMKNIWRSVRNVDELRIKTTYIFNSLENMKCFM